MAKDITPELMQKYFEAEKLGKLSLDFPGCSRLSTINVDLPILFRHITDSKFFEYAINPRDVESIAVYGSVLHKHFPKKRKEIRGKKYILFGPEVVKKVYEEREIPSDLDVMVITKEGFTEDKVIIPERKPIVNEYGYVEAILSDGKSGITTKRPDINEYGYIEGFVKGGDLDLHITYRSVEQFLEGLGKGDELSESVIGYGIPIIGQERFSGIVKDIQSPKREALHQVEWNEDLEGKLQGKIL